MVAYITKDTACIHQDRRANDIRLKKDRGVFNGSVYMALRREIYDCIWLLFFKKVVDSIAVTNIQLNKVEVWPIYYIFQCRKVSRISQFVQTDDPVFRVFGQHVENKVRSDKYPRRL